MILPRSLVALLAGALLSAASSASGQLLLERRHLDPVLSTRRNVTHTAIGLKRQLSSTTGDSGSIVYNGETLPSECSPVIAKPHHDVGMPRTSEITTEELIRHLPIMTGPVTLYFVFYGDLWLKGDADFLETFGKDLTSSGSPYSLLSTYWGNNLDDKLRPNMKYGKAVFLNTTAAYPKGKYPALDRLAPNGFGSDLSQYDQQLSTIGLTAAESVLPFILDIAFSYYDLPADPNGFYMIVGSEEIKASLFASADEAGEDGRDACGWHSWEQWKAKDLGSTQGVQNFVFGFTGLGVSGPGCAPAPFKQICNPEVPADTTYVSPNTPLRDTMATIIWHEIVEAVSDGYVSGVDSSGAKNPDDKSLGQAWTINNKEIGKGEIGDACDGVFGTGMKRDPTTQAWYNIEIGSNKYLLQHVWINDEGVKANTCGYCGLKVGEPSTTPATSCDLWKQSRSVQVMSGARGNSLETVIWLLLVPLAIAFFNC